MTNRKGVFVGAYVPNRLKESLRRRAAAEHRTLSQEITHILEEAVHGKSLPASGVDRRNPQSKRRLNFDATFDNRAEGRPQNSATKPVRKLKQNWAGGLSDYRGQYTSLELQKKALEWRGD
ncbi:MAG TPA: hypothetical protein VIW64_07620 [Pyrinomonadaceae bacterium]|jgi:plasmid stability protein